MSEQQSGVLYLTPAADRFILAPAQHAFPTGDLTVATLDGQEYQADAAALIQFEVTEQQAQAHFRGEAQQALAALRSAILGAPGRDGAAGSETIRAAVERYTQDVRAVSAALAAGDAEDVHRARETLARHGVELGDSLGELTRYLHATREQAEADSARGPVTGSGALGDRIRLDRTALGRRVDSLPSLLTRSATGWPPPARPAWTAPHRLQAR